MPSDVMTKQEAIDFFADLYGGEHHIPGQKIERFGSGWCIYDTNEVSTYDSSIMTKLVVMAHDRCYRIGVMGKTTLKLRISIHKRKREGGMMERHPALEDAVQSIRSLFKNDAEK